jgi:anti-sigma B factor antagonist
MAKIRHHAHQLGLLRQRSGRRDTPWAHHMEESPQFGVELLRTGQDTAVIALEGAVDIYSAPQFKEALLAGIEDGATIIVVDFARVTFIDSTALGVLVSGAKRVQPKNGRLDIVCTDENIIRIFEITGLDHVFDIYRTRDEALRAVASTAAKR